MNLRSFSVLAMLALTGGCALIYPYGEYKDQPAGGSTTTSSGSGGATTTASGSGGASTTTSSTGTAVGCVGAETCVLVPTGWQGPVAMAKGSSCTEAGWTTLEAGATGGTSVIAPTGCTCSCTGPMGGSCPGTVTLDTWGSVSCPPSTSPTQLTLTTAICTGLTVASAKGALIPASGAMCSPSAAALNDTPRLSGLVSACKGGAGGPCENGGVCAQPAAQLCVYAEGAADCPSGFPTRAVVYRDFVSDASCTACTCSVNAPPLCSPLTTFYGSTDCSGNQAQDFYSIGACSFIADQGSAMLKDPGTPAGGACLAGGGMLQGNTAGTSPFTMCCTP